VPGTRIRGVEVAGRSLSVLFADDGDAEAALTVRHGNEDLVAALGAEISAIIDDGDPGALERRSALGSPWRMLAGMPGRSSWWRRALVYAVLGFPLAVWVPVEPGYLGFSAWLLLPAGLACLRGWMVAAELDTLWVIRRRGITVRAAFESDSSSESDTAYIVRFRTLDGQEVTAYGQLRGYRDEIRYDPEDPTRVLAATRVARLGIAVAAFLVVGVWGVLLCVPAIIWLIRLVALL